MARGRARHQKGRVVSTPAGAWEIHYNVYLTDPATGQQRRHHRSRVVGYRPKMRRSEAQTILETELAAINAGPTTRTADGSITFGEWMKDYYVPVRGGVWKGEGKDKRWVGPWRTATQRSNSGYLGKHIYPALEHVALKDISKLQVQALLNRLAGEGYSYTVVYHVRDLIKAALAEAVDNDVIERNVARKTEVPPNIVERDKHVLPLEMYPKLLASVGRTARERAIFMLGSFCALRPSELFGLMGDCYEGWHDHEGNPMGGTLLIVNTAWRGLLQKKKIKKRPVNGETAYRLVPVDLMVQEALEAWLGESRPALDGLIFPGRRARGRLVTEKPMHADNWLRRYLYPAAEKLEIPFHPSFQVLRRSFGTHADELKMASTEQIAETLGHATGSKITRLHYIVKKVDPAVREMQRRVTERLLRMDDKASGAVQ